MKQPITFKLGGRTHTLGPTCHCKPAACNLHYDCYNHVQDLHGGKYEACDIYYRPKDIDLELGAGYIDLGENSITIETVNPGPENTTVETVNMGDVPL